MKQYNLFISHSWNYQDQYIQLNNLLKRAPYFEFKNYSIPKNDPLIIYNKIYYTSELKNKIKNQMKYCNVVLVLAGVYASYSSSINMEIEIAKELNKPIIAVEQFGAERTSSIVKTNADIIVKWNSASIVEAIKKVSI